MKQIKKNSKNYSKYSFQKGLDHLMVKDYFQIRKELKELLGITTNVGLRNRIDGVVKPNIAEKNAIENLFSKYGVTDIWGSYES